MAVVPTPGVEVMRGRVLGTLLQFDSATALLEAGGKARAAGYRRLDAHSPFPVHGIEDALGIRPTILPWIVLVAGMSTGLGILFLQYWVNATGQEGTVFVGYPYRISGKPLFGIPANIPPTFEATILGAAFTAFFGMLALNGLPKLFQPLFRHRLWTRVTDDKFLLWIPVEGMTGSGTDEDKARRLKEAASTWGATAIEALHDVVERRSLPTWLWYSIAILCAGLAIPPAFLAWNYHATSTEPRIHPFWDMDFQPRFEAQEVAMLNVGDRPLFADRRAMRPREPGVVPYSRRSDDIAFLYGIDSAWYAAQTVAKPGVPLDTTGDTPETDTPTAPAESTPDAAATPAPATDGASADTFEDGASLVMLLQDGAGDGATGDGGAPQGPPEPQWTTTFPEGIAIDEATAARGQARYNIYCAVCHGKAGFGNGPVSMRAFELQSPNWVQPANFHTDAVKAQPVGRLFNTISAGRGKMSGYAGQIPVADRWAIVLYLKSLQAANVTEIKATPVQPGSAGARGSSSIDPPTATTSPVNQTEGTPPPAPAASATQVPGGN